MRAKVRVALEVGVRVKGRVEVRVKERDKWVWIRVRKEANLFPRCNNGKGIVRWRNTSSLEFETKKT